MNRYKIYYETEDGPIEIQTVVANSTRSAIAKFKKDSNCEFIKIKDITPKLNENDILMIEDNMRNIFDEAKAEYIMSLIERK